jgi:hypothetical protein
MVTKTDFSTEEWLQVLMGPQMAALVVIMASPSGPMGAVKEVAAISQMIADAIQKPSGNALIDAVAADYKERMDKKEKLEPPQLGKDPNAVIVQCLQACTDLAALVDQKAPDEATGYKEWVYQAAKRSSEAAKEGGFLGMGGTLVSPQETAALKDVAEKLGLHL